MRTLTVTFDKLSQSNPSNWLYTYYTVYSRLKSSVFTPNKEDIDNYLSQAEKCILKFKDTDDNEEVFILKAFHLILKMKRISDGYNLYGNEITQQLELAGIRNPENPRYIFCKTLLNQSKPEEVQFNIDANEINSIEKMISLFYNFQNADELMPSWGEQESTMLLKFNK